MTVPIIDMHVHSAFSDGGFWPNELAHKIYESRDSLRAKGVELVRIALTDHDSCGGIEPLVKAMADFEERYNVEGLVAVTPGCEISTVYDGVPIHVVGLFPHSPYELIHDTLRLPVGGQIEARARSVMPDTIKMILDAYAAPLKRLTGVTLRYDMKAVLEATKALYAKRKSRLPKGNSDIIKWPLDFNTSIARDALTACDFGQPVVAAALKQQTQEARAAGMPKCYEITLRTILEVYSTRQKSKWDLLRQHYGILGKLGGKNVSEEEIACMAIEDCGKFRREEQDSRRPKCMPTEDAIKLIHKAHGVAVLAHPGEYIPILEKRAKGEAWKVLEDWIRTWRKQGLDAIETHYRTHDQVVTAHLMSIAGKQGLLESGGTDYHGREGETLGIFDHCHGTPADLYEDLVHLSAKRNKC